MKIHSAILLPACALFFAACADQPAAPDSPATGSARITVKMAGVGVLGKRADIEFARLIVTLSASGESLRRDTFELSGHGTTTLAKVYDGLAAGKTWTLSAVSSDRRDSLIHSGSSSIVPVAGLTTDLTLSLQPRFTMLKAAFFPIPDSVTRCQMRLDDVVRGDSTFLNATHKGDTVLLAYDYVTTGASHSLRLDAFGDSSGGHRLLYRADTTLSVASGVNGYVRMVLKRVASPAPSTGGINAQISLGRVWTVTVDGVFEGGDGIPAGAVRNISGVLSASRESWSRDTLYRIVGNSLLDESCTLSIAPGTRVEFANNSYLEVRGQITAVGTETDSILIESGSIRLNDLGPATFDSLGNYVQGPRFEYCSLRNSTLNVMNVIFSSRGPYLAHCHLGTLASGGFAQGMFITHSRIDVFGTSQVSLHNSEVHHSKIGRMEVEGYSGPVILRNNRIDHLTIDRWNTYNRLEMNILGTLVWHRPSTSNTAFLHGNDILGSGGQAVFSITQSDGTQPIDASGNYWGGLTAEMDLKGANADITGIRDFHDDFNLVKVDYSGWSAAPIPGAGPAW